MSSQRNSHTDWANIFKTDRLHIGDVIEYEMAYRVDPGTPAQGKLSGPYQGTIFDFNFPNNTVGVRASEDAPKYYTPNSRDMTCIIRVISRKQEEK